MSTASDVPHHSVAFRRRRFLNWFPLGLAYALLYMGRYNLTVAKTSLGHLMTKEDFGLIFGAGTVVYAIAFLVNGPLVDRYGGRRGMLVALAGSTVANAAMGVYLKGVLDAGGEVQGLRGTMSMLYGINMYFQSFAAVSIVKVNAHWFHVRERGGFSGIFGTMISSGIFLAFTLNGLVLDLVGLFSDGTRNQWVVFAAPALLLFIILIVEATLLRDRPGAAGFADFDTGDASSGDDDRPTPTLEIFKKIFTNPIILTVAFVELCTGVLRNGVMHWFPIYAKEVWVLDGAHPLMYGPTRDLTLLPVRALACGEDVATEGLKKLCTAPEVPGLSTWVTFIGVAFVLAVALFVWSTRATGSRKGLLVAVGGVAFIAPFFPLGWGGLLFVAGVIGGNVAGWVSDLFFQSRRAPAAGFLYGLLAVCVVGMVFALAPPRAEVAWAAPDSGLEVGDVVVTVAGKDIDGWDGVRKAVTCFEPVCEASTWDPVACSCTTDEVSRADAPAPSTGTIPAVVERGGVRVDVALKDPKAVQRAGDARQLKARPVLPMSPWVLGVLVFLMSLAVIGTHGLLSGTATMDFGGRKAAGTAVGIIDGFVYLGTALQSVALGTLTGNDWTLWPLFLFPFSLLGVFLLTRIWHAKAGRGGH